MPLIQRKKLDHDETRSQTPYPQDNAIIIKFTFQILFEYHLHKIWFIVSLKTTKTVREGKEKHIFITVSFVKTEGHGLQL